jgi:hypothetical protein
MSLKRQNATTVTDTENKATEKKKNKTPIRRGGGPDKKNRRTLDKGYQEDFEGEEDEQWISNNTISDPFPEEKVKQKIHPEYGKLRY